MVPSPSTRLYAFLCKRTTAAHSLEAHSLLITAFSHLQHAMLAMTHRSQAPLRVPRFTSHARDGSNGEAEHLNAIDRDKQYPLG